MPSLSSFEDSVAEFKGEEKKKRAGKERAKGWGRVADTYTERRLTLQIGY